MSLGETITLSTRIRTIRCCSAGRNSCQNLVESGHDHRDLLLVQRPVEIAPPRSPQRTPSPAHAGYRATPPARDRSSSI